MKKLMILGGTLALIASAHALPLYDSFTTYGPSGNLLASNTAPTGESWIAYTNVTVGNLLAGTNVYVTNYFAGSGSTDTKAPNLPVGFPGPLVPGNDTGTNSLWTPGFNGSAAGGGIGACLQFSNDIAGAVGGKIYVSLFVDIPDCTGPYGPGQSLINGWTAGFLSSSQLPSPNSGAGQNTIPAVFEKFNVRNNNTSSWKPGVGDNSVSSGTVSLGSGVTQKTVHFVVMSYEWGTNGTVGLDVERIWLDPAANTFGANTEATGAAQRAATPANVLPDAAGFFFLSRSASSGSLPNSGIMFNSLRIATNWAFVTGGAQFTRVPASVATVAGGTTVLSAQAVAGGLPVSYQWQTNGINMVDGGRFSGSTNSSLTISNSQVSDAALSYALVINTPVSLENGFSVTSAPVTVTIISSVNALPNGTFQLNYTGFPGAAYRLWNSSNIALTPVTNTWTLLTNTTFSGSATTYIDVNATNSATGFYTFTSP